jgi:magnesium transporter
MIRVSLLADGRIEQGGAALLDRWEREPGGKLWVDICAGDPAEVEALLEERFGFHELAAEDALSLHTLPKHDPFPDYDFFIFRSINVDVVEHGVETRKLAVFLSSSHVFTIHAEPSVAVESVWARLPHDTRILASGTDFLLYTVLDVLIDLHFPLIEQIEDRIEEIHDQVFSNPQQSILDELLHYKRDLSILRRNSQPQRELLNSISRSETRFIQPQHLIYFRDLYDHMYRINEWIDLERDQMSATMDAYLSVIAIRTNDIMKVLTIFSSILLPVNLVAGIYGMNFERMPELSWPFGYLWALSLMALIAVIMLGWFAHRGWILPGRARKRLLDRLFRRPAIRLRRHALGRRRRRAEGLSLHLHD